METEKTCKNCKLFYQHYVQSGYGYRPTYCGHCAHKKSKKLFNPIKMNGCEEWQQSEKRKETYASIKHTLLHMARMVRNIANVLENDQQLYGRTSLLPDQESTETLTTQVSESALGEKDSTGKSSAE